MKPPTFTLLDRLRKAREHQDLTQAKFAEKIGISQVAYSRYESGARKIPDDVVKRAAEVTEIPLAWFYAQDDTASTTQPPRITLEWDGSTYQVTKDA